MLTMFTSSGASCRYFTRPDDSSTPIVFVGPPTLSDVIYTLNTNTAAVRQLYTDNATLTASGAPPLRATVALEKPRNFRLRARLIQQELDIGSNAELFWIWAKSDPDHAMYYAYHEQFNATTANRGIPIGPDWLIEAVGLVHLDPQAPHEGPTQRPDGNVEIRSQLVQNGAAYSRLLVVDSKRGFVLEQYLWDTAGRPMATARCSNHSFYQESGVSLPHRIQVELPMAQLSFQIDIGRFSVNQLQSDPTELWTMRSYEGYRLVNIADEPMGPQVNAATDSGQRVVRPQDPRTSYQPRYRGVTAPSRSDPWR